MFRAFFNKKETLFVRWFCFKCCHQGSTLGSGLLSPGSAIPSVHLQRKRYLRHPRLWPEGGRSAGWWGELAFPCPLSESSRAASKEGPLVCPRCILSWWCFPLPRPWWLSVTERSASGTNRKIIVPLPADVPALPIRGVCLATHFTVVSSCSPAGDCPAQAGTGT